MPDGERATNFFELDEAPRMGTYRLSLSMARRSRTFGAY
ncbi:hypothetical protein D8I24_4036 (plasmid) [Cupriavidus necator H850]|nr:hypothetical protein D8I24_4036 [Cupriavidus necator H850]